MKLTGLFLLTVVLISGSVISGQNLPQVQASPHAKVFQEVGLSDITIDYHRPAVKGREVWGKLVPYGMVNLGFGTAKESPWRAGANENTTISFSDDVKINGNSLLAGTYGLHMIPSEKDWVVIFNKKNDQWGSYTYNQDDDALRITVTPVKATHQEWLMYGFDDPAGPSATAYLHWEKVKVPFKIKLAE